MSDGDGAERREADTGGLRGVVRLLGRNWPALAGDVVVVAAWAATLVAAFATFGGPRWLFDLALLAGIVAYTFAREPLETREPG